MGDETPKPRHCDLCFSEKDEVKGFLLCPHCDKPCRRNAFGRQCPLCARVTPPKD